MSVKGAKLPAVVLSEVKNLKTLRTRRELSGFNPGQEPNRKKRPDRKPVLDKDTWNHVVEDIFRQGMMLESRIPIGNRHVDQIGMKLNKFNGKISKVTIDLKEMKTADREKADKAQKEAAVRKALSD